MVLMNLFEWKEWRCRCREWIYGHIWGGESGTNREGSINIYTLSCLKWIAGEKLLYNTGSPVWCSLMT